MQRYATDIEKGESASRVRAKSDSVTHDAKDEVRDTGQAELDRLPSKTTECNNLSRDSFTPLQCNRANRAKDMYRKEGVSGL